MHTPQDSTGNWLLAALPKRELQHLKPHLTLAHLKLGKILHAPGHKVAALYFPVDGIISNVYLLKDGGTAEVAVIGNEGVAGVALLLSGGISANHTVVQVAGDAYRLPAKVAQEEFYHARELRQILLRYVQALLTQMGQNAVCNRHHTIEQQFCRWLLMSLDRLPSNEVGMTQELIANMLGVRREGVSVAAHRLREEGLISYRRGCIIVNDRKALEASSCECYEVIKKEYARLLRGLKGLQ